MTSFSDVERLLRQTMGLDTASIGLSALERAVHDRRRACHLEDPRAYLEHVQASETELQALIEAIVVPETWFFRGGETFEALVRFMRQEWEPLHDNGGLRLLSVPCSTGEEPYSMAMALLDAGLPPAHFRIDAMDICRRSLAHAERRIYGKSSFRSKAVSFRERHFTPLASGHRLSDAVRQQVVFQHANLLSEGFLPGTEMYDVIFCRNLLIYFDAHTQARAIAVLRRLLTPTGMLFVGSSESGLFLNHGFASARVPMAFAFRKGNGASQPKRARITTMQRPAARAPLESVASNGGRRRSVERTRQDPSSAPPAESVSPVEDGAQLADQGRFVEASQWCEEHLRQRGPSAGVFHLLGLVRDALGNASEAATYYRKALYLDPRHEDVLIHLALLMQKQGQESEAQVLWNRVKRLATQGAGR